MWSFRAWRQRRWLARHPLDPALWQQVVAALPLLHGLTEAQFWSGDYPGAEAGYASLLKRYPDDAEIHASLAATLIRLERVQDAERPSAQAVALAIFDHP